MIHHFDNEENPRVYAKQQFLAKGDVVKTHSHAHDHLSIGAGGPVIVEVDGEEAVFGPQPFCIRIEAGKKHTIRALGDSHWFCIWPTNETDVAKIDASVIKE